MPEIMESPDPTNVATPWEIFDYEVEMWRDLLRLYREEIGYIKSLLLPVQNAIAESLVLHTRVLVDILLSRKSGSDDILLDQLLPEFKCSELDELKLAYGDRSKQGSPYSTFNKRLAHATTVRGLSHNYAPALNMLEPIIEKILSSVHSSRYLHKTESIIKTHDQTPISYAGSTTYGVTTTGPPNPKYTKKQ